MNIQFPIVADAALPPAYDLSSLMTVLTVLLLSAAAAGVIAAIVIKIKKK